MINFDSRGYLKPYEPISSNVKELKKYFVDEFDSEIRLAHFHNYTRYSNDLKKLLGGIPLRQWINGSFVSKKTNPKDIDFVTFVDHTLIKKLNRKLDSYKADGSWEEYGVDAYIIEVYSENNPHQKFTEFDMREWQELFCMTRRNRAGQRFNKGFLEIIY
ncbi:hypothetical protein BH09BAC5_BH09BAC5_22230 [soil metagenome]